MIWPFKYRSPADILVLTYVTFSKMRVVSLGDPLGRTEPPVIRGPHLCVRQPLYLGVVLLVLGFWVLLDYALLLFSAMLLLLWFNLVVTPFEKKELRALFGDQYLKYSMEFRG